MLDPFEPVTAQADGEEATLAAPLRIGATLTALDGGPTHLWHRAGTVDVLFASGTYDSKTEAAVLSGANRFAVETPTGWEVFAARDAVLTAPQTYRLSCLLRGLEGSDAFIADSLPGGARVLWLGSGVETLGLGDDWRGADVTVSGETSQRAAREGRVVWNDLAGLPLSPVHGRWDGTRLSWIGRDLAFTDWTEESGHLRYRVRLFRGSDVEVVDTPDSWIETLPFDRAEVVQLSPDERESLYPLIV